MTPQTHYLFIYFIIYFYLLYEFCCCFELFLFFVGEKKIDFTFNMGECLKNKNSTTLGSIHNLPRGGL